MDIFDQIKADIQDSFAELVANLNEEFDEVITSESEFSDLGFAGQDIVDTGRLRDSKIVAVSSDTANFSWNPKDPRSGYPYAKAVQSGFFAYGKKYIPGRPWDLRAVANVDPISLIAGELRLKGYKVKIKKNGLY